MVTQLAKNNGYTVWLKPALNYKYKLDQTDLNTQLYENFIITIFTFASIVANYIQLKIC